MSDSHEEHNGGHELDNLPAEVLFKVVFGLGAIVLAAVFVVAQFLFQQTAYLQFQENGAAVGHYLGKYWDEMDAQKEGLADVANGMRNPAALKAGKPYAGWQDPSDVKEEGK